MLDHVVEHRLRGEQQPPVERHRAGGRARRPAGALAADGETGVGDTGARDCGVEPGGSPRARHGGTSARSPSPPRSRNEPPVARRIHLVGRHQEVVAAPVHPVRPGCGKEPQLVTEVRQCARRSRDLLDRASQRPPTPLDPRRSRTSPDAAPSSTARSAGSRGSPGEGARSVPLVLRRGPCSAAAGSRSDPVKVRSQGLEIAVAVEPAAPRVGENALGIELRDAEGQPRRGADLDVAVRCTRWARCPRWAGPPACPSAATAATAPTSSSRWAAPGASRSRRSPPGCRWRAPRARSRSARPACGSRRSRAAEPRPRAPRADAAHPGEFRIAPERLQRIGVRTATRAAQALATEVRAVGTRRLRRDRARRRLAQGARLGRRAPRRRGRRAASSAATCSSRSTAPSSTRRSRSTCQALRSQERARDDRRARARRLPRARGAQPAAALGRRATPTSSASRSAASRSSTFRSARPRAAMSSRRTSSRAARSSRASASTASRRSTASGSRRRSTSRSCRSCAPGSAPTSTLPSLPGSHASRRRSRTSTRRSTRRRAPRACGSRSPNPDLALRPDMFASVRLHADRGERLVVPQSAVLHAGERSFVFLDLGGGRFRPQPVEVGMRSGEQVEIVSRARGRRAGRRRRRPS